MKVIHKVPTISRRWSDQRQGVAPYCKGPDRNSALRLRRDNLMLSKHLGMTCPALVKVRKRGDGRTYDAHILGSRHHIRLYTIPA